jgi:hypothetical protein
MRTGIYIFTFAFLLLGCHNSSNNEQANSTQVIKKDTAKKSVDGVIPTSKKQPVPLAPLRLKHSKKELLAFLDSISHISVKNVLDSLNAGLALCDTVKFPVDSEESIENLSIELTANEFAGLKKSCRKGAISIWLAKKIFPNLKITKTEKKTKDSLYLRFYPFDEDTLAYKHYAIQITSSPENIWDGTFYFFHGNKLIARHYCFYRFGPDIDSYADNSGDIYVFYKECFGEGAGLAWFHYYFFKYISDTLTPVLNVVQGTSNELITEQARIYGLDAKIIGTDPLKIKMNYSVSLNIQSDSDTYYDTFRNIINDSDIVTYRWDGNHTRYVPEYSSKLSDERLASFYAMEDSTQLARTDLLFLHSYSDLIKSLTESRNDTLSRAAFIYLDAVKSEWNAK